jgi:hypothetical protein
LNAREVLYKESTGQRPGSEKDGEEEGEGETAEV